jgi:hypothetical protein
MDNITIKSIEKKELLKFFPIKTKNEYLFDENLTLLGYEWDKEMLNVFVYKDINLVKDWLTRLHSDLGFIPENSKIDLREIFPQDKGINFLYQHSWETFNDNNLKIDKMKNISKIFLLSVSNGEQKMQDFKDYFDELLTAYPEDTQITLGICVDENVSNSSVYVCGIEVD